MTLEFASTGSAIVTALRSYHMHLSGMNEQQLLRTAEEALKRLKRAEEDIHQLRKRVAALEKASTSN
jgi:hypothetical protein